MTKEDLDHLQELLEREQLDRVNFITNLIGVTAKAEAVAARLERAANTAENAASRIERGSR